MNKKINYLKDKGAISLIAPSFGCTTEPYISLLNESIRKFKNLGYKIYEGKNIYLAKDKARSNTPYKCAKEFMDAYLSNSDCVISVGGGETMIEILPHINFKKIKNADFKFFMGFSDNTNLTYTLTTICDIYTIYGPNFPQFAFYPDFQFLKDSINLLKGEANEIKGYDKWERYVDKEEKINNPLAPYKLKEEKIIKIYPKNLNNIELEGILLGGCLDCLKDLCGTRFDNTLNYIEKHKKEGIIWYLESCDLNPLGIKRTLFQLKEAGWFKYVKGFLIGRPLCYKEKIFNMDHYYATKSILKSLKVPIVMDIDLGHFTPSMPIINGCYANVIIKNNNIYIKYKL